MENSGVAGEFMRIILPEADLIEGGYVAFGDNLGLRHPAYNPFPRDFLPVSVITA